MHLRLDWLSFTIQVANEPSSREEFETMAFFRINNLGGSVNDYIFNGLGFAFGSGRAPYRFSLAREDHGCFIFGGSNTSTILVECTGRFFDSFNDWRSVQAFVEPVCERVSRLDVAADFRTDISPDTFVGSGYSPRFKANGRQESETGITCYVGSASSDCFARVYRYSDPHPRSPFLRVECVYRRGLARSAARAVVACSTIQELVVSANRRFQWQHPLWSPSTATDVRIEETLLGRDKASTVFWLYKQVAPALRKLMESSDFSISDWLMFVQGKGKDPYA